MDTGEHLCLACGLCCDGSLFDNVRLGPGDDEEKLKALGLPVKWSRARKRVSFIRQPCSALCADRACRVYADRPAQCRAFECSVFKELQADRITLDAALRSVKQVRRKADKVRRLLRKLGCADESLSLNKRFRRAQRHLESGAAAEAAGDAFAELGLAMHQLDLLAHKKFYAMPVALRS